MENEKNGHLGGEHYDPAAKIDDLHSSQASEAGESVAPGATEYTEKEYRSVRRKSDL